jgi:uncharacterized membrane protein
MPLQEPIYHGFDLICNTIKTHIYKYSWYKSFLQYKKNYLFTDYINTKYIAMLISSWTDIILHDCF